MSSRSHPVRMVNIPRRVTDEFYRYKMPDLIAKVESKGNGIKTVLVNMADVAKALKCPASYPTKYLGFQLGALTTVEDSTSRYIVNGKHDQSVLAGHLDTFIDHYILCKKCHYPEALIFPHSSSVQLRCRACGSVSTVTGSDKMNTFIIRNPPPTAVQARKDARERREREENEWQQNVERLLRQASSSTIGTDTSCAGEKPTVGRDGSTSPNKRVDGQNTPPVRGPSPATRSPATSQSPHSMAHSSPDFGEEWLSSVRSASTACDEAAMRSLSLDEKGNKLVIPLDRIIAALHVVFSAFDETILQTVTKRAPLLSIWSNCPEAREALLDDLCSLVSRSPSISATMPSVLKGLYDNDVLDEISIIAWKDKHLPEAGSNSALAAFLGACAPFIEWLEASEEEENEDE